MRLVRWLQLGPGSVRLGRGDDASAGMVRSLTALRALGPYGKSIPSSRFAAAGGFASPAARRARQDSPG
jgi:hypothetical protein